MMANSIFGERLRMLRKRAGMTQQAVAAKLNVHRTAYTKYETSGVTPDPQGLVILAQLFGVTVDYLVGREEEALIVTEQKVDGTVLSLQEQQLVQIFRQLPYAEQQLLVQQAQRAFRLRKKKP